MNELDARQIARNHRKNTRIPGSSQEGSATLCYIELSVGDPAAPAPVRDVLAWLVRFHYGIAWGEIAVDAAEGDVVRVEYSRAAIK